MRLCTQCFYLYGLLLLGCSVFVFSIIIDFSRLFFKKAITVKISIRVGEETFPSISNQSWVKSLYFCYSLSEKVLSRYLNLHLHCIVWVSFMFILLGIWIGHAVISYSWPFPIFKIGFVFPCHFLWIPCLLQVQVLFHLHCPKLEDASFIHCHIFIYIFC